MPRKAFAVFVFEVYPFIAVSDALRQNASSLAVPYVSKVRDFVFAF